MRKKAGSISAVSGNSARRLKRSKSRNRSSAPAGALAMRQFYAAWLLVLTVMPSYDALSLEPEKYLKEGLVQLYNLEYAQARASFRKVVEVEPDNPFGYLFEAGAIWWQAANEYSLFQDTPTFQRLFQQDIEAAIRKADPLTDSRQKEIRADGHFIMGM